MSEASAVYLRMKELFAGTATRSRRAKKTVEDRAASQPFGSGRDPRGIADVMDALTAMFAPWTVPPCRASSNTSL